MSLLSSTLLLIAAQTPSAADTIQAGINQAIAAGAASYTLPAGTITLSKQIRIPEGTKNFTLQGSPSGTTIKLSTMVNRIIEVGLRSFDARQNYSAGPEVTLSEMGGLTQCAAPSGTSLTRTGLAVVTDTGPYAMYDPSAVAMNDDSTTSIANHAEIVNVTAVNGDQLTLGETPGRDYSTVKLVPLKGKICTNITVKDITIDGSSSTTWSSDPLVCSLIQGLTISNVHVKNYFTDGISLMMVKNATVSNCDVDSASSTGPGEGYGFQVARSRGVNIVDCSTGTGVGRHAVVVHSGSMNTTLDRFTVNNPTMQIDLHGMDERNTIIRNCVGQIQIGNSTWRGGENGVQILNCDTQGTDIMAQYKCDNVTIDSTTANGVRMISPYGFTISNSVFVRSQGSTIYCAESTSKSRIIVNNCSFDTSGNEGTVAVNMPNFAGFCHFQSSTFVAAGYGGVMALSSPLWFRVEFDDCGITAPMGYAVVTATGTNLFGQVQMTNSRIYSTNLNPTVIRQPLTSFVAPDPVQFVRLPLP